jgi:glycine dehydrogenase subunit 2
MNQENSPEKCIQGATGLVLNEPLLWEKGKKGRTGISIPKQDVEKAETDPNLVGEGPDFPDLSEVDIIRHYTRLSQWNYGVDAGHVSSGVLHHEIQPKDK